MLADGPDAQAEPGPEQDDVDQDEQHQRHVHDAAALGDHAAERGQQQQHRSRERRLPQVGGEQQAEDVFETAHVGSGGGAVASDIRPAAGGSSGGRAAGALPKGSPLRIAPTKLAAMLNRISACRTSTRLLEIPASLCMIAPPECSAPKSTEASTMPTALPRPSRATAMASKPVVSLKYLSVRLWSTPAIWTAPARPENAPAMSIVRMMVRRTLTPA